MEESIMDNDILRGIIDKFDLPEADLKTYSPLTLAFLGDCVYDLVIRTILVERKNRSVNGLHKDKSSFACAEYQAKMSSVIKDILTEEELDVFKRGRNAKTQSHAKNAGLADYHKATGLECLIGYLYLQGKIDRILDLFKYTFDKEVSL